MGITGKAIPQSVPKILANELMPLVQYFSYVEITDRQHQNLLA